jgi:hypothetical protein
MSYESQRDPERLRDARPGQRRRLGYGALAVALTLVASGVLFISLVTCGLAIAQQSSAVAPVQLPWWLTITAVVLLGFTVTMFTPGVIAQAAFAWVFFARTFNPAYDHEPLAGTVDWGSRITLWFPVRHSAATRAITRLDRAAWAPGRRGYIVTGAVGLLVVAGMTRFGGVEIGTSILPVLIALWWIAVIATIVARFWKPRA